jgi:hypothetical protein
MRPNSASESGWERRNWGGEAIDEAAIATREGNSDFCLFLSMQKSGSNNAYARFDFRRNAPAAISSTPPSRAALAGSGTPVLMMSLLVPI